MVKLETTTAWFVFTAVFLNPTALALQTLPVVGQFSNGSVPYTYEAKVIEIRAPNIAGK